MGSKRGAFSRPKTQKEKPTQIQPPSDEKDGQKTLGEIFSVLNVLKRKTKGGGKNLYTLGREKAKGKGGKTETNF